MEKAGNLLNVLLKRILEKKNNTHGIIYSKIYSAWGEIVGQKLLGHTKIIDLKNNKLIIAVDHPGWMQLLKIRENVIFNKIRKIYPNDKIKSMKIIVSKELFQNKDKEKGINKRKDRKTEVNINLSDFNEILDKIKDSDLKESILRLIRTVSKSSD